MSDNLKKDIENVNSTIANMNEEELEMALKVQDAKMMENIIEIMVNQSELIKSLQDEIQKDRMIISTLVTTMNKAVAKVEMVVSKQKDLEEFALIASGIKQVFGSNVEGKAIEESKKNIVEKVVETLQKGKKEGNSDGEETNEQE